MPIDIATGAVELEFNDVAIPGEIELTWDRFYSTSLIDRAPTALGLAWTSRYYATLTRRQQNLEFINPLGSLQIFADAEGILNQGNTVRDLGAFLEVFRKNDHCVVQHWNVDTGEIVRYIFPIGLPDKSWCMSSLEDETGQALDLHWDTQLKLIRVCQRLEGRELVFRYTAQGLLDKVVFRAHTGEERTLASYDHDESGRLIAAYNALDVADRYQYDDRHRLTREIVKDGGVFTYLYDERNRCVKMSGLNGYQDKRLRFIDAAFFTEVTDSYGATVRYEHLPTGQIIRVIDAIGREKKTKYDNHGRIVALGTADGHVTRYAYDDQGNRSTIVDVMGNAYVFTHNQQHLPVSFIDPIGHQWHREYDEFNRLVSTIDPLGGKWGVRYNSDGTVAEMTNALGASKRWAYEDGIVTSAIDWFGNAIFFQFDSMGRMASMLEPLNLRTLFEYDSTGNLLVMQLPDATTRRMTYDVDGNLISYCDGNRNITTYRYGPCRRLLETVDAEKRVTRYKWGTEPDRLQSIENENGELHHFQYDSLGRVSNELGFDAKVIAYEYDNEDHIIAVTNGETRIQYLRDPLGRLMTKITPTATSEYTYDATGKLILAKNSNVELRFSYDAGGGLTNEVQRVTVNFPIEFLLTHKLDAVGNRIETILPSGDVISTQCDASGDWLSLQWQGTQLAEVQRDAVRRETYHTLGHRSEGLMQRREYDSASRLIALQLIRRDKIISRNEFIYDPDGQLVSRFDAVRGAFAYQYDATGRLQSARSPRIDESFRSDPAGNPMDTLSATTAIDKVAGNLLQRLTVKRFEYDDRGNTTRIWRIEADEQQEVMDLQYDSENQLVKANRSNSMEAKYYYDPLGRRVAKTVTSWQPATGQVSGAFDQQTSHEMVNESHTIFVWDSDRLVQEVNSDETITYLCKPESFVPIAQIHCDISQGLYAAPQSEEAIFDRKLGISNWQSKPWATSTRIYYINNDHLGTPQEAVTFEGSVVWMANYKAWGGIQSFSGSAIEQPLRFQGQYEDTETGLFYNRHRYYDPDTGRYLSQDPIGFAGGDNNFYRYAPNPFAWIDPLGLTGTYIFQHADGSTYVGKGPEKRMEASIKQREAETGSKIVGAAHTDFTGKGDSRMGFMTEHELMELHKFREPGSTLLNEIASPGKTRENKSAAEIAQAKKAAKALNRKLEADKKARAKEAKQKAGKAC
jgi:RHS repeat-associated protein